MNKKFWIKVIIATIIFVLLFFKLPDLLRYSKEQEIAYQLGMALMNSYNIILINNRKR